MKIVVLNAGSGSLRCSLFHVDATIVSANANAVAHPQEPVWEAKLDVSAPHQPPGKLRIDVQRAAADAVASAAGGAMTTGPNEDLLIDAHASPEKRTRRLLELLWKGEGAPLRGSKEIDVVGHRVVHGGERYDVAVRIDADVEKAIKELYSFAPLHNPANLTGIRVARELFGAHRIQVAVFDTAFHRALPAAAAAYAGPHEWLEQGIRRYGFHGTNFRWVAARAAHLLGRADDPELRLILCHLGGGCSLCATRGGRSIDTTMGFTPLDGIAMGTRSGAIDPGILIYLQRQGRTADELEELLNKHSGLKGLSGISGDTREVLPRARTGDVRAQLAIDVWIHQLRGGIGRMLAALGAPPAAIVFTDAIAEDEPDLRAAACAPFEFLGLRLDERSNRAPVPDCELSAEGCDVKAWLIRSREAWQIACECAALVGGRASISSSTST